MNTHWRCCLLIVCCLGVVGCSNGTGKKLGRVSGTVTIGGKPTANVQVQFSPVAGGRTSVGVTDEGGKYELSYDGDHMGAEVGKHTVTLAAHSVAPSDDTMNLKETENPIPKQDRNKKREFEVQPGSNTFDIKM